MNETREIPEGQHNEAGQEANKVHEDKGKPPLPPSASNTSKKDLLFGVISLLLKGRGEKPRAACNYYGQGRRHA